MNLRLFGLTLGIASLLFLTSCESPISSDAGATEEDLTERGAAEGALNGISQTSETYDFYTASYVLNYSGNSKDRKVVVDAWLSKIDSLGNIIFYLRITNYRRKLLGSKWKLYDTACQGYLDSFEIVNSINGAVISFPTFSFESSGDVTSKTVEVLGTQYHDAGDWHIRSLLFRGTNRGVGNNFAEIHIENYTQQ